MMDKDKEMKEVKKRLPILVVLFVSFLLLGFFIAYVVNNQTPSENSDTRYEVRSNTPVEDVEKMTDEFTETSLVGTIQYGEDIGIDYCAEGLYLVTPTDQQNSYLLREGTAAESVMLDDTAYMYTDVVVTGYIPDDAVRCEALTCGCEEYLLVNNIEAQ